MKTKSSEIISNRAKIVKQTDLWENNKEIGIFQEYLRIPTVHPNVDYNEEIGGKHGMATFVKTDDFKLLNVGFSLDEGIAGQTEIYPVFYGERSIWHPVFKISGTPGHGSLLLRNTAGEKLRYIIDKMMDLREHEVKKTENNPQLTIGDVTTVNVTQIQGGVQNNIVPPFLTVGFDLRLATDVDHKEFQEMLEGFCIEAGGGIEIEYEMKGPYVPPTPLDATNPYWVAFKNGIAELGLKIKTQVFPGGTDSQFIREIGIPAIGFSPMNNTPVLLHDHDEFIKVDTYLNGIEIYKKLIPKIANA